MCTCLIMIIIVFKLKNKKNETEGQSEVHKICNIELLYVCVCVLSQDERPISHLNKKINEKYMLTTGEKSII
jgi:hypothetical protein